MEVSRRGREERREDSRQHFKKSINRAMITHRKVKSKSQRALETFWICGVITWHTSQTAKIRVSSLSLKCRRNACDYLCHIRDVQRRRQEEDRAEPKTLNH